MKARVGTGTSLSPGPVEVAKMADVESLFDFIHMEIVAYFLNKPGKDIDVSTFGI